MNSARGSGPCRFRAARMEPGVRRGRDEGRRRCTGGSGRRPRRAGGARREAEAGGQGYGNAPAAFSVRVDSADSMVLGRQGAATLRPPSMRGRRSRVGFAARPCTAAAGAGVSVRCGALNREAVWSGFEIPACAGGTARAARCPSSPGERRQNGQSAMRAARSSPRPGAARMLQGPRQAEDRMPAAALSASSTDCAAEPVRQKGRSYTIIL